jgi:predicted transcriptional regulator
MIKETAEIVSAYLTANRLPANEIADVIRSTYAALVATTSQNPTAEEMQAHPAVPVKRSVTPAAVICLDCGKKFSMLKRHLHTDHDTTPDDYRAKWGLPSTYPMVAPDYAARRSALAVANGLGHKTKAASVAVETPKRGRKKAAV